jgi:hypothetical protein
MILKVLALISLIGLFYEWSNKNLLGVVACGFITTALLLLEIAEKEK